MKVLFLVEGELRPGPRYRVMQYIPFYRAAGIECIIRPLHWVPSPSYDKLPYLGKMVKALVRGRRLWHIRDAADFDLVYLQRMTLPFSSIVEKRLSKINPRFIFDIDDPLFQKENGPSQVRKRVFTEISKRARRIVAGSEYLRDQIGHPEKTLLVPTVVNTDLYKPKPREAHDTFVVGWMGTVPNFVNFEIVFPVLDELAAKYPQLRFKVISSQPPPIERPYLLFKKWSEKTEVEDLQSFDIGIMPLRNTTWNNGKCAFKLIQYMSVGIPAVGSAVGANRDVLSVGGNGFLASNHEEWKQAIESLLLNPALREEMGAKGREVCVARYSIASQCDKLIQAMHEVAES